MTISTDPERQRFFDELEYRVRTAVALKLAGHDIDDEVFEGKKSIALLLEAERTRVRNETAKAAGADVAEVERRLDLVKAIDVAIGGVLFNVRNFPDRAQAHLLGQNMLPLRTKVLDAVLAAIDELAPNQANRGSEES